MKLERSVKYAEHISGIVSGLWIPGLQNVELLNLFRFIREAEFKDFASLVRLSFTKAQDQDIIAALEILEKGKILKKVGERWKILCDRKLPKDKHRIYYRRKEQKDKSGSCPKCGHPVEYKNRHARSGTQHTGDECRLNQIKSIMGE